ncbi:MAG: acyltransferase [Nitrospira sp.]
MNNATSIYLDLVRFLAALLVFVHHLAYERITGTALGQVGMFGEDAVMIFFVLSGYVIAYVATQKENAPREYFASRFARLYSVVVPTLILTVLFDYLGQRFDAALYEGRSNDSYPWMRALVSMSFANQFWFSDIRYFSNVPYWSISFEFWYYVLFGVALFMSGRGRWAALAVLTIVIGPPIVLLAPVWLLGVWAYQVNVRSALSLGVGWSLFLGSVVLYLGYRYWGVGTQLTAVSDAWIAPVMDPVHLHKARFFLHDYVVGALVASHFLGASALAQNGVLRFPSFGQPIRIAASYTFSLYLLHYPLLHFLAAVAPWPAGDIRRTVMLIVGTVVVIGLIGRVTEKKKHVWKRWLLVLWDSVVRRVAPKSQSSVTMVP